MYSGNEKSSLRLLVSGKLYGGWEDISVKLSIETISGEFSLGYFDSWHGQTQFTPIHDGAPCEVRMGGDTVITGYVDDADDALDAENDGLTVSGRDATGDLVDCSAVHKPDQWNGQTLPAIARTICAPFGIGVKAETDCGAPFPTVKVQPGETAFAIIERLCRMRAVLPVSDGRGNLVLTSAGRGGRASTPLVEGENILSLNRTRSQKERFSEYTVKGQQGSFAAAGETAEVISSDGTVTVRTAAPASGRAKDAGVARYRPLVIIAEGEASGQSPATRAMWEATVRGGRGLRIEVTVQGWRQNNGELWRPNTLVHIESPRRGLNDTLLIVSCAYSCSASGTLTTLSLARPDAYKLIPIAGKPQTGLPECTEILGG